MLDRLKKIALRASRTVLAGVLLLGAALALLAATALALAIVFIGAPLWGAVTETWTAAKDLWSVWRNDLPGILREIWVRTCRLARGK